MNKQNRGDMPPAGKADFASGSPLYNKKAQMGFEQDNIRSGNLRDHNGKVANEAAIKATTHYDGDYGLAGMVQALRGAATGSGGGPGGGRGAGGFSSAPAGSATGNAPISSDSVRGRSKTQR